MLPPELSPQEQFNGMLKMRLRDGWKITSDGPTGVQLELPRRMRGLDKAVACVAGLVLFAVPPLALIMWAAVVFDYFYFTKPKREFLMRPA